MKKKREFEPNPETPLDHWSVNVDPAIMSGDHWVEEEEAPLRSAEDYFPQKNEAKRSRRPLPSERFLHPVHQVGEKPWTNNSRLPK
ncbi:Protein of unknown function [Evansella caseinilytica]|uniref:DUF3905 domain-containing protein n=1 Tax=Evansella caseinilytica TaxID=1503961 RepID=A0A1H3M981_9BACI|nr:DUF3905 domain-containing protein [Evansella caseinilytica]SDY72779.1 Protein of unknown function [Evansella caseinilytica]